MRPMWTPARRAGRVLLIFGTAMILSAALPATQALADPAGITAPPAKGAQPGSVTSPTAPGTTLPPTGTSVPGVGPLATQIALKATELAKLAEQAKSSGADLADRVQWTTAVSGMLAQDQAAVAALEQAAGELAAKKYADSQATPDFGIAPQDTTSDITDRLGVARAELAESQAAYDAAIAAQNIATQRDTQLRTSFNTLNAEVTKLVQDNQKAIADAERARAEFAKQYQGKLSTKVKGYQADPKAIQAVQFAYKQLGKPYVWGDEGPGSYDCSGLTWAAYNSVGVTIPRVANDQYHITSAIEKVDPEYLLPGDLIFYGDRPGDWTSIYHVGMYVGNGNMIQAPTAGDVVKISPVWFNDFFGATRPIKAVKGNDDGSSTGSPSGSPSGKPSTKPPTTPPTTPPTKPPTTPPTKPPTTPPSTPPPSTPAPSSPEPSTGSDDPGSSSVAPSA